MEVFLEGRVDLRFADLDAARLTSQFDDALVDEVLQPVGAIAGDEVFAQFFARDGDVAMEKSKGLPRVIRVLGVECMLEARTACAGHGCVDEARAGASRFPGRGM